MEHKSSTTPDSSSFSLGNATPLPVDQEMEEESGHGGPSSSSEAKHGGPPTSLPLIVVPQEETQPSITTPADPLMLNPDYVALKHFVEGSKLPEANDNELSEDKLIS